MTSLPAAACRHINLNRVCNCCSCCFRVILQLFSLTFLMISLRPHREISHGAPVTWFHDVSTYMLILISFLVFLKFLVKLHIYKTRGHEIMLET